MALRPVSVTQLNEYISRVLATDPLLGNISVVGEISNLKYHSSGHVYFSIVDENSKVNCFLPSSYAEKLQYRLDDGLEIVVRGYINVYKKGGTYTLFVRSVEVSGDGNLAQAFQIMKEKLEKEGLFDPGHKKPIRALPRKVGVITSNTGAAVQDILKIITGRTRLVDVTVFPVLVQGDGAAQDIAAMIDYVNGHFDDIDTLIVGRGGGSMEDLWAFNEEAVARAIYRSRIPIISAVGHETDFTIADFVADKRAETPTAAAEMAVPDDREYESRIKAQKEQLLRGLKMKADYHKLKVERQRRELDILLSRKMDKAYHELDRLYLLLEENRPGKILEKGYAMIEDGAGQVITSAYGFAEGGRYRIRMKDGTAVVTVSGLTVEKEDSQ